MTFSEPRAFSTASSADFGCFDHFQRNLGAEIALGQHPDTVQLALHETGFDQCFNEGTSVAITTKRRFGEFPRDCSDGTFRRLTGSWLDGLREDNLAIFWAASQTRKTVDSPIGVQIRR